MVLTACKPFDAQLVFPPLEDVVPDQVELDFSDVFGPLPVQAAIEVNCGELEKTVSAARANEFLYDEPATCLALHETGDSQDIVVCVRENVNGYHMEAASIGIEDFEVLKVVGQGAFGKVYQVRKKGTSEIYAMKVMRKDKIMEKNHEEYMKAERDILEMVDHPFIVQLKYSFQVNFWLFHVSNL